MKNIFNHGRLFISEIFVNSKEMERVVETCLPLLHETTCLVLEWLIPGVLGSMVSFWRFHGECASREKSKCIIKIYIYIQNTGKAKLN